MKGNQRAVMKIEQGTQVCFRSRQRVAGELIADACNENRLLNSYGLKRCVAT